MLLLFTESGTFTAGGLCRFINSTSRLDGGLGFSGLCLFCNPGGLGFSSYDVLEGGLCLFCSSCKMPSEGGLCRFTKSNVLDGNPCPSIILKWDFLSRIMSFEFSKKLPNFTGGLFFQPKLDSLALPILSSFGSGATQSQNAPRTKVTEMVKEKF